MISFRYLGLRGLFPPHLQLRKITVSTWKYMNRRVFFTRRDKKVYCPISCASERFFVLWNDSVIYFGMIGRRAENNCRLQRSTESMVLFEKTSDCSIWHLLASLQRVDGRIKTAAELDSSTYKAKLLHTWKAFLTYRGLNVLHNLCLERSLRTAQTAVMGTPLAGTHNST